MKSTKATVALTLIILLVCAETALAVYVMTAPQSVDVTVNPALASLSQVTVSSTVITVGDSLTLSTTVSDHTAGLTVTFYNQNNIEVGTATTNSAGTATLTIQPPEGTWSFYASANHP